MDGAAAAVDPMTRSEDRSEDSSDVSSSMDNDNSLSASPEGAAESSARQALDRQPSVICQGQAAEIHPYRVVEAILFASDTPLPAAKIASILGVGDARDVRKHIAALNEQYASQELSFLIEEIAGGFQILTLPVYNTWLTKLLRVRDETKLSQAALETLAIVAYKQPATRADIEAIRGVAAGDMLNRLRELNLVKIVGRAEDLGRPLLYGTTRRFLEVFGLAALEDLPQVESLRPAAPVQLVGAPPRTVGRDGGPPEEQPTPPANVELRIAPDES